MGELLGNIAEATGCSVFGSMLAAWDKNMYQLAVEELTKQDLDFVAHTDGKYYIIRLETK